MVKKKLDISSYSHEEIAKIISDLSLENKNLKKEISKYEKTVKEIEASVRDEYLHTSDWTKDALVKLVNFAAIELEPASIDSFPQKVVCFLGDKFFGYPYIGFYEYNSESGSWKKLAQHGSSPVDSDEIPVFSGNMILEEEGEIYNFFTVQGRSYMICVSTLGIRKKLSNHDYSFVSLFVTLMSSFFNMKMLSGEVERRMVEASTRRNLERLLNNLKNNSAGVEEVFAEMAIYLSIDSFLFAVKPPKKDDLKIVISQGVTARNWDSFLKMVFEDEAYFCDEWMVLPVFDEHMTVYGVSALKLSSNNPSLKHIQEKILYWMIPQVSTILSQKKFHKESITDDLTGAYNRRYVLKILEEKFKKSIISSEDDHPLSVVMLDIDHFKPVNDTYGHQAGDLILKEVVNSIGKAVRETDIIGRYGGEEFIILLSVGKKGARNVCERIRRSIENSRFEWSGKEVWVTVSMGCVTYTDSINTWEEMVSISDVCLYEAKKTGRNKVVEY